MPKNSVSKQQKFWMGFSPKGAPDFKGKRVLEIGCGHGERCFEILSLGAEYVVGLDLSEHSINEARSRLKNTPEFNENTISFFLGELETLPDRNFDVIVSEDTFEHIMNVPQVLEIMFDKSNPGATAYLGFGPLYNSPFGDHGWMRQVLPFRSIFSWPWGHLIFTDSYIFKKLSKQYNCKIQDVIDWPFWTLNRKTRAEFIQDFLSSSFEINLISENPGYSLVGKLMSLFAKLPFGKNYLVWGLYVVLKREHD